MDEFFARNRLSAYIDGELSDAEMAEVARAIEEQPELRAAFEELQAAVELLRQHGPMQAPDGFHRAVMQRVEGLSAGPSWLQRLLGPLGRYPVQGLGVAVVAAAVMLLVFRGPMLHEDPLSGPDLPGVAEEPAVSDREAAVPGPQDGLGAERGQASESAAVGEHTDAAQDQTGSASEKASSDPQAGSGASKTSEKALLGTRGQAADDKGALIEELMQKEPGNYIPDWDKEASAPTATIQPSEAEVAPELGSGALATSPFTYRLTPTEPDALRRLVALAEKLGGGMYSPAGEPLDPYMLTVERNYAQVVLHIPASRLESVEPYLRTMGGVITVHAERDRLYPTDSVHVAVEVQYQP